MKTVFTTIVILFFSCIIFAQTPQRFNYQAVARAADGTVMVSTNLGIRVSIVDQNSNDVMYSESHSKTTNRIGLFNLQVGQGTLISGEMATIDWSASSYDLKVDIDYSGGTDYTPVGSSQILSVPYALHAETVSQVDDADADPSNEIQSLSIEGTTLTISDGNSVNLPATGGGGDGDNDPNNEIQDISSMVDGSDVTLEISRGGIGTTFSIADSDADASNELQTISKAGSTVTLSNGGGTFEDATDDADADASNELQTLSLTGNTLSIANGNSIVLPISGGTDADADPMNEIQMLSKSGNTISLSLDGGNVTDEVDDADADPTNELQQLTMLAIADAGIDGMTQYQLQLTGNDPIDLPFNQWWGATILTSLPPQVGNINTPYPVAINNALSALSANIPNLETLDLTVGDATTSATHIQSTGIHWDGGTLSNDLGWFLEKEELRYGVTLPSSDFKAKLTKEDLSFLNEGGWTSSYLGGASSGELSLYPGGGTPQFFRAWLDGTSPKILLNNFTQKIVEGRPSGQGGGEWATFGSDGNRNIWMTHLNNFPDNGWLGVIDGEGVAQAVISVNSAGLGVVTADMKNFVMDHPLNPSKNILYASLEGPEAGAYERGTSTLTNGEANIQFSEHFNHVIGTQNMTVMITPLSADSKGIAVIEKRADGFRVKELLKGKGTYEFDWEVKAVRAGFEDYNPVVDKAAHSPASTFEIKNR